MMRFRFPASLNGQTNTQLYQLLHVWHFSTSAASVLESTPAGWRQTQGDNLDKFVTGLQRDKQPTELKLFKLSRSHELVAAS